MRSQHVSRVFEEDSDPNPEEILVRYDHFIVALVEKMVRRSSNIARPEVVDLEIDEIAQRVRIKLWHALVDKHIEHPQAYIRTIVRNEFNDIPRKRKSPLPLLTDEDGELYMSDGLITESESITDPADEVEAAENLDGLMNCAASAISRLSLRQQRAISCFLNEQIDARMPLIEAFEKHDIDIEAQVWPEDETDKKLLKASLSIARRRIAEFLEMDLSVYKKVREEVTLLPPLYRNDVARVEPKEKVREKQYPAFRKEFQSMNQQNRDNESKSNSKGGIIRVILQEDLATCMNNLQEPYKTAVVLHCVEERSYLEIARLLNLPEGTVKSHVSRGMKMLQRYLGQKDTINNPGKSLNEAAKNESSQRDLVPLVRALHEPYQTSVYLHCVEKRSYPEIAQQLNLPEGTVKSHVSRGMKMIFG